MTTERAAAPPRRIDLNADVGESFGRWRLGDDEALLETVTSVNVACGFHAGDPVTLRRVCDRAGERGVAIGAQVGYRDLAGFGRRFLDVEPAVLREETLYQLGALEVFARRAGGRVSYLKPHGALYNAVVHHAGQAAAVLDAVEEFNGRVKPVAEQPLSVLGLPGSELLGQAQRRGIETVHEAFADRGYTAAGTLVPRTSEGALVTDPDQVVERVLRLAIHGELVAVDGTLLTIRPQSICLHGDTPAAAALARSVSTALREAGVTLAPFSIGPA